MSTGRVLVAEPEGTRLRLRELQTGLERRGVHMLLSEIVPLALEAVSVDEILRHRLEHGAIAS